MTIVEVVKRVGGDRSIRSAAFSFALTRLIVFTTFIVGTHIQVVESNRLFGEDPQELQISLVSPGILQGLREIATRGDGGWYLHIASRGYERIPFEQTEPHNWAFFPLFPMLWRAAAALTGGYLLTGLILTNVLFFFALIVLHRTATAYGLEEGSADRAVFYTAAFPASYFFSIPMAESLFLLLTASSFLTAKRDRWFTASVLGMFAAGTRLSGLLLLPTLLLLYWQSHRRFDLRVLWLLVIPVSLFGFMVYLNTITGNPLAFAAIEPAWGRKAQFFLFTLWEYLQAPLHLSYKWNFKALNFLATVLAFGCGFLLLRRRQWAFAFYVLAAAILPLSSGTLQSMTRYMMVAFPIFFVLGTTGKSLAMDRIISVAFVASLAVMTTLCAIIVTLALS
ncbi:MAG TPA: mannosyltransferase family protein [Pyrinomonadaceae bacterium]|nr:mannosyltransferase family protein [Pyrinomonadaceae bacterium]